MTKDITDAAILNLERAERLIRLLDGRSYSNTDGGPYYSSLHLQGIALPDVRFGYNPTTPASGAPGP
jgi:hypothetical protein